MFEGLVGFNYDIERIVGGIEARQQIRLQELVRPGEAGGLRWYSKAHQTESGKAGLRGIRSLKCCLILMMDEYHLSIRV